MNIKMKTRNAEMKKLLFKSMKYCSPRAIEYMQDIWGFQHSTKVDDLTMLWECQEYEVLAKYLWDAGGWVVASLAMGRIA